MVAAPDDYRAVGRCSESPIPMGDEKPDNMIYLKNVGAHPRHIRAKTRRNRKSISIMVWVPHSLAAASRISGANRYGAPQLAVGMLPNDHSIPVRRQVGLPRIILYALEGRPDTIGVASDTNRSQSLGGQPSGLTHSIR
jgi:hypothetical protein